MSVFEQEFVQIWPPFALFRQQSTGFPDNKFVTCHANPIGLTLPTMTLNRRKSLIWVRILAAVIMLVSSLAPAGAVSQSTDGPGAVAAHAPQFVKVDLHTSSMDQLGTAVSMVADDSCRSGKNDDHHGTVGHEKGGCCSAVCFPFALNNHSFSLAMPAKPVLGKDALTVLISTEALLLDRPPRI